MAEEVKSVEELLKEAQGRIAELEELTNRQKAAIDNACSDAAKHKKDAAEWQERYKATLSEQEKAALEAKQKEEQMLTELNGLKAEKRVAFYKSKLMEAGYDADTADVMANSLPEGVSEEFFATQKTFLEAKAQEMKTQALNSQPSLSVGNTPSSKDALDTETDKLRKWMGI